MQIVVEPSANHLGDINNMIALIDRTMMVGADYIKFQCYTADSITIQSDKDDFTLKDGPWKGKNLWDLYDGAHTPRDWFPRLIKHCGVVGVKWFASVYCREDVDFLETLGCPMYKIASYEITDLDLIRYAAQTGKPLVISTGMASWDEISSAVRTASGVNVTLMHCVSAYPTPVKDAGLRRLLELRINFPELAVGLSDHSLGRDVAVAAAALGADAIEKHMCISRDLGGPDSHFSMEPDEFRDMVEAVHAIHKSITEPGNEVDTYSKQQRRSLYAIKDIAEGDEFTRDNIRSIRPGYGLKPSLLPSLLGTKSPRAYLKGQPLT